MNSDSETAIAILIQARSGQTLESLLKTTTWSPSERRIRAAKTLIGGFALTLGFLFLPIAHFILVPMGLIITPIIALKISGLKRIIPRQGLLCPKCSSSFEFPFAFQLAHEIEIQCDACREVLRLTVGQKAFDKCDP